MTLGTGGTSPSICGGTDLTTTSSPDVWVRAARRKAGSTGICYSFVVGRFHARRCVLAGGEGAGRDVAGDLGEPHRPAESPPRALGDVDHLHPGDGLLVKPVRVVICGSKHGGGAADDLGVALLGQRPCRYRDP